MRSPALSLCIPCIARLQLRSSYRQLPHTRKLHTLPAPTSKFRTKHHGRSYHSVFKPFVPPAPTSLPKPAPPKTYRRTRKTIRRLLYLAIGLGIAYEVDKFFLYSSLTRSARTFWLGSLVATDYKINFRPHPPLANSIQDLHTRNAERLFDLLRTNGGLYLKIGQAIAMQVKTECFVHQWT